MAVETKDTKIQTPWRDEQVGIYDAVAIEPQRVIGDPPVQKPVKKVKVGADGAFKADLKPGRYVAAAEVGEDEWAYLEFTVADS